MKKKYIDAEAFREDYHRVLDNDADWDMARVIDDFVYSAPAADVREVRHGYYWGEARECIYLTQLCSHCKNRVPQAFYCLNCGAKMDGEVK